MTRRFVPIILALGVAASPALAGDRHHSGMNVSIDHDGPVESCARMRVTFAGMDAARAEENFTIAAPRGALKMRAPSNSGIFVHGGSRSDIAVTACKAAADPEDLARIAVSAEGGDLQARGPEGRDWVVHFIVRAPRSAGLDLEVNNGPLAVRGMTGAVTARTQNGPLSLEDSSGQIHAEARNGPISVKECTGTVQANAVNGPVSVSGSAGDVTVSTQNGPISVKLSGDHWSGQLDAQAKNGPLSLSIPDGYASPVRVESAGRSPFQCRAKACAEARKNWTDDSRTVEFGDSGTPVVRLSTVNGPVSINSERSRED
jgi:ribosomal protein L6P/L9E